MIKIHNLDKTLDFKYPQMKQNSQILALKINLVKELKYNGFIMNS